MIKRDNPWKVLRKCLDAQKATATNTILLQTVNTRD